MSTTPHQKPTILWLLQDNQVTPLIADFLKLFKEGMGKVNIQFIAPAMDEELLKVIKPLNPATFEASRSILAPDEKVYQAKRELIHEGRFKDGLEFWKAMILDDLGAGMKTETAFALPRLENIHGIILQIPTPLGSASPEEIIFYEWVKMAKDNNVFIAGYELLPLRTRWTLVPSMLDGIITNSQMSYEHLKAPEAQIKGKVWKLPTNERMIFTPTPHQAWQWGVDYPYRFRQQYQIPRDKTIFYIPHNVALSYEYRQLLEEIGEMGEDIHLMFSIGKDQIRGSHSHQDTIELICKESLKKFHSYSFHNLNDVSDMTAADAVVAMVLCYTTTVARNFGLPCIAMDDMVPECREGGLLLVNNFEDMRKALAQIIDAKKSTTALVDIIYEILNKKHPKIDLEKG